MCIFFCFDTSFYYYIYIYGLYSIYSYNTTNQYITPISSTFSILQNYYFF